MNWSKIKTIFIICFLLLNVFLAFQLYQRQHENEAYIIDAQSGNAYNQFLSLHKIDPKADFPSNEEKVPFLKGSFVNYSHKDVLEVLEELQGVKKEKSPDKEKANDQKKEKEEPLIDFMYETDPTKLHAVFNVEVSKPVTVAEQQTFLKNYVYMGDQYKFWQDDQEEGKLRFIQLYNNHPIFTFVNNEVNTLELNIHENKVTSYDQHYLEITPLEDVELTFNANEAFQRLWEKNYFSGADKVQIESIELSYYNQSYYVPAWYMKIKIDDKVTHFFVDALHGKIMTKTVGEE